MSHVKWYMGLELPSVKRHKSSHSMLLVYARIRYNFLLFSLYLRMGAQRFSKVENLLARLDESTATQWLMTGS